jgi:glycosyltransferase involved in cell wall biosynthesis
LQPLRENPGGRGGLTFVVITPARNEEDFIGLTLESMVRQTLAPVRWVIVSDGSTDRTEDIVEDYVRRFDWIDLVRLPVQRERSFAAKVQGFNAGYDRVKSLGFDLVGNLDADISFEPGYFEFLIARFAENPRLGVAGTPFVENGRQYDYRFTNIEHVSGACQLFRRECFEQIGGYAPIKDGGIDWAAVTTARMQGWQTRTFVERNCTHHRPMGTGASAGHVRALFRHGQKDYALGGHPMWQLFRGAYQMTRRPYVVGGAALLAGYVWALVARRERPISIELVQFTRSEQMARLKAILFRGRKSN